MTFLIEKWRLNEVEVCWTDWCTCKHSSSRAVMKLLTVLRSEGIKF